MYNEYSLSNGSILFEGVDINMKKKLWIFATMPYGTEGSYTLKFASKKGVTEFSL